MKTVGSNALNVRFRATPIALLILLAFALPPTARASTPQCDPAVTTAHGGYFTAYQSDAYSPQGFLIQHFKNDPTYPYTRPFTLSWWLFDDECNNAFIGFKPSVTGTIPAGVTDWSIRFASSTHFDVWDDDHHTVVASSTIDQYPPYTSISFHAGLDPEYITLTYLDARTGKIMQDGQPPLMIGTLVKDTACPSMYADTGFFDPTYEHAEYVDHLLRVHLRLERPSGGSIRLRALSINAACNDMSFQMFNTPWDWGTIPLYTKYYSFRMTTPTHWVLWNDETDMQIVCPGCEGDLPPDTPYVSFYWLMGQLGVGGHILTTTPFHPTEQGCTENCNDNVLFLPGIEASRLYIPDPLALDGNDRLWEPTSNADARELFMTASGTSMRSDIYTKDVMDEAYGTFNIYKSFLADLDAWKNTDHIIADYGVAPYDWRLTLDDILDYGNQLPDGRLYYSGDLRATSTPYIIQQLRSLAASPRTGKVTIVAHSNGGLVAKALLKRLQDTHDPLLDKVDMVIMVAVPQTGTPHAIGAALHGYKQAIPFDSFDRFLSAQVAREFAHDDPMVHHLLPSSAYFTGQWSETATPVIRFNAGPATHIFTDRYGATIDNVAELRDFLLGAEGRAQSDAGDLADPSVLRPSLIAYGESAHSSLDTWTPPASTTVHEIAGWGEDTAAGIVYDTDKKCVARLGIICTRYEDTLRYKPDLVVDGDGTVVAPSALAMSTSTENVRRWWVDLKKYNNENIIESGLLGRDHKGILEVPQLRSFIRNNILTGSTSTLPSYILHSSPESDNEARLHFFLHSPLALSATDTVGGEISASTSTIPGAHYRRFGEVQYISVPVVAAPTLHLEGFAAGSFTLEAQEVAGNTVNATTTFLGIPNATTTTARMSFPDGTIERAGPLVVDEDGDGDTDITLRPRVGEIVVPDTTPPEITITFATSTNSIAFIGTDDSGTTTIRFTTTYPSLKKNEKKPHGVSTTTVTARDEAGNTTALVYTEKLSSSKQRDTVTLQEIAYNGATTTLASTSISYKWRQNKGGAYKLFASHLQTAATSTESHYRPKKDQTIIMIKPRDLDDDDSDDDGDTHPTKERLPGMIIPSAITNHGRIIIIY